MMPMLIEHIDKIARSKQRDVVFAVFHSDRGSVSDMSGLITDILDNGIDWENLPIRKHLITWLESEGIEWRPCGFYANENLMCGYYGQIYIDVPFVPKDPNYQKVLGYLENPDGTQRYPNVTFCVLTLTSAIKNAHHDEPGFWDRWAENF